MEPIVNKSNDLMHTVMTQAVKSANSPVIQQLSSEQRDTIMKIIKNTDNIITNYEQGKDEKLDTNLISINFTLGGSGTKREESTGLNILRGIKNKVGSRHSSSEIKEGILSDKASYRDHIYLDPYQLLPSKILDPRINFKDLPHDTQKLLNNLLFAHVDLSNKNVPLNTSMTDPVFFPFLQAHLELQQHLEVLDPKIANYLKSINDYLFQQFDQKHVSLDFSTAIPSIFLNKKQQVKVEELKKLPDETKHLINKLLEEHYSLKRKNIPPETDLGDPVFVPLYEAEKNLMENMDLLLPKDTNEFITKLINILRSLRAPNSQRPFLVFEKNKANAEVTRDRAVIQELIDSSANNPDLALEHQWALEGFIQSIRGFNLWEKISLEPVQTNPEAYTLKISSRVNDKNTEISKSVEIPLVLTPFRQDPKTPLTQEQDEKLFKFLRKHSPYVVETEDPYVETKAKALAKLDFLSPEQKELLFKTHIELYHRVNAALLAIYQP